MAGLDAALRVLWDERHPQRPLWLPNLLLKHVTRTIMKGVLSRSVDTAAMRSGPSRSDRDRLRTLLDDGGWAQVEAQCVAADAYMAAAWARFRALPLGERPMANREAVSEKACTDVRAVYGRATHETTDAELADAVVAARERYERVEITRAPLLRKLVNDSDEFVARCRDRYETSWRARDIAAHDADPPWRLGLGTLARPPLGLLDRRSADDDRMDWHLGTDRPVFARYRHYISKRGAGRVETTARAMGVGSDQHMWSRLHDRDPDELAHAEVDRATEPLGLRFPVHRSLLAMLRQGVIRGDVETARRGPKNAVAQRKAELDRWCAAHSVLPAVEDESLINALGHTCASAAVRYSSVTTLAGSVGARVADRTADLPAEAASDRPTTATGQAEWTGQVELGVLRRMWLECLACEVEWGVPLTPARLPKLVPDMFGAHLVELVTRPITRPEAPRARDEWTRQQDTLQALGRELQDLALAALSDAHGWRDRYDDALRRADPDAPPGHFLDAEELRVLVTRLWAVHDRGEPDDPDDAVDDDGGA